MAKAAPGLADAVLPVACCLLSEDSSPLSRFGRWPRTHWHPFGDDIPSQRFSGPFAACLGPYIRGRGRPSAPRANLPASLLLAATGCRGRGQAVLAAQGIGRKLAGGNRTEGHEGPCERCFEKVRGRHVGRMDAIEAERGRFGHFALFGNDARLDAQAALGICRNKDMVGKCFADVKGRLDFRTPEASSPETLGGQAAVPVRRTDRHVLAQEGHEGGRP